MKKITILSLVILFVVVVSYQFGLFKFKAEAHERISGAYKALNFWSFQRAYPFKAIPDVGYYQAFKVAKQKLSKSVSDSLPPWQAIGPHNMGGRTLAIAFNPQNPNTIYAGSASGGLWRSYTGGVGAHAWEYVHTGYPVLAVSSIAFAPDDSNTIYIGTGEVYNYQSAGTGAAYRATRGSYGIGILKSNDGGLTWEKSLDWSYHQQRGVWAVKVNPLNPNTVWAATTEGTYKSTDAGEHWNRVLDVIMATDLIINPQDTNVVVVGCGNFASEGHGIYRTVDGGSSWTKITQGLPETFEGKIQLAMYRDIPAFIYASIGNGFSFSNGASWLCMSTDAGATWGIVSTEDYSKWQGWYSHDVAVDPINLSNVIAVGIDVWKSTSGGMNLVKKTLWSAWYSGPVPPGEPEGPSYFSHADHHDVIYHPENSNIIYFATDGGVFRSTDGGETFEGCNGGYQTVQFYNGFACSYQDSSLAIGGMQDNGTIIYRGSTTWDRLVIGGDGCWSGIDATNDHIMYGSYQNLHLMKSTQQGRNWRSIQPPGSSRITVFAAPFVVGINNPDILYAGRDIIYKSTSGGNSWSTTNSGRPLDGNPALAMAISHQTTDVVYVSTAPYKTRPGVFRTRDGGQSWDNITGSLPDRFPMDVAVDPTDDRIVYVTFSGFGTSHVFKSVDGGDNWQDIGIGLPDVPTSAVTVDPKYPNIIYVGNDLGVYASRDGGTTWVDFSQGLPDAVIVMDLVISPANRKLRVATHGNGAYERDLLEGCPVTVQDNSVFINNFTLNQNYPNPFNASTTISYSLEKSAVVNLIIFNSMGQVVRTLVSNQQLSAGNHRVVWDGKTDQGVPLASGTYIYQLRVDDRVQSKQMLFLK